MEYGGFIGSNLTKGEEEQLENVLDALRNMSGCKAGTSHFHLKNEFDLPTIKHCRYVSCMVKFYKVIKRSRPGLDLHDFVTVASRHFYPTRQSSDLTIPLVHTELCKKSFWHLSIQDWNKIPDSTRELPTKTSFKKKIQHTPSPPEYYGAKWNRISRLNLSRLRCVIANLNLNLYECNLSETPKCECKK